MRFPSPYRMFLILCDAKGRIKLLSRILEILKLKNNHPNKYQNWKSKYLLGNKTPPLVDFKQAIEVLVYNHEQGADSTLRSIQSIKKQGIDNIRVSFLGKLPSNIPGDEIQTRIFNTLNEWYSAIDQNSLVMLIPAGDMLLENFAGELLANSQANPNSDVFYCDSAIRFNEEANDECHFKPSFSPYTLASRNFIGRSFAVRAHCLHPCEHAFSSPINHHALLLELYGKGCAFLRIPGVYYLEVENGGREPKQIQQIAMAIEKAMPGSSALVSDLQNGYFDLRFPINDKPLVSVIIPSRDAAEMCHKCLSALFNKTHYPNFEVLLIDNGSKDPSFFSMVEDWQNRYPARFRVIRDDAAFNFSRLMNLGAHNANGSVLLLMNNDIEAIHADWMDRMVEVCMRKDVGVTSAKLLYPNNTVQHAGAVLGLGDAAGHILVGAPADAEGYYGNLVCLTEYSIMTAACMMVTKEIYWSVNGFEEALSVEFNDFDFCLKVHAKGKHNLMIPQATLYHHESITRGHPRENPKTYKRYVGELNKFKNTWSALIPNDPAYNPYLSKVSDDFRMG